jgi:hypothetical protein
MTEDAMEFADAIQKFRERTGSRFPTVREMLRILQGLGYEKRDEPRP